jgi:hypothetical protein
VIVFSTIENREKSHFTADLSYGRFAVGTVLLALRVC